MLSGAPSTSQYPPVTSSFNGPILQRHLLGMPGPSNEPCGTHNFSNGTSHGPSQPHYAPGILGAPATLLYPQDMNSFHYNIAAAPASTVPSNLPSEAPGNRHENSSRKPPRSTSPEKHDQSKSPLPLLTMELSPLTKPPKAPEKPLAPYLRFSKSVWESVKKENPNLPFVEIAKIIGQQWRNCPEDIRDKFAREFLADKEVYAHAQKAYLESPEYLAWHTNKMKHEQMHDELEKIKRGEMRAKEKEEAASAQRSSAAPVSGGPLEELQSMSQRIVPFKRQPQPPPPQLQPPGHIDECLDDDITAKQLASSRYRRNHRLLAEVFSEGIVPDGRMLVGEQRMDLLRKQVQSLSRHQERLMAEQQELMEKHQRQKRKLSEDTAAFTVKWAKVEEDHSGISKEQYQAMVDKYYKVYEKHMADYNAQNLRRSQLEPQAPLWSPASCVAPAPDFQIPEVQTVECQKVAIFVEKVAFSADEVHVSTSFLPEQPTDISPADDQRIGAEITNVLVVPTEPSGSRDGISETASSEIPRSPTSDFRLAVVQSTENLECQIAAAASLEEAQNLFSQTSVDVSIAAEEAPGGDDQFTKRHSPGHQFEPQGNLSSDNTTILVGDVEQCVSQDSGNGTTFSEIRAADDQEVTSPVSETDHGKQPNTGNNGYTDAAV